MPAAWLAIDTATDTASIALVDRDAVAEWTWTTRRRHTEQLAVGVARLLADRGAHIGELDGIAVSIGPGSYTGLRIGLALAKGVALVTGVPVVGVPTLDVVAAPLSPPVAQRDAALWAVLRAGRGRVVAACYPGSGDWPDPTALRCVTGDDLLAAVRPGEWVAGELEAELRDALGARGAHVLPLAACVRRAGWLAEIARRRIDAGMPVPALDELAPVYLR